ncbi:hypothetical protein AB0J01_27875 [Streptomyces sp. NPDC050204]|uniref:MmyB family transcriptional regulator n=1 Tax=Streptomyces sp. NPDC050204 TaxID=3155514 RepID=UPI0034336586
MPQTRVRTAERAYQQLLRFYRQNRTRLDIGLPPRPQPHHLDPLRQCDLDEALKCGVGVYQKVESGTLVCSVRFFRKVARRLGFSEEDYATAHRDLFPQRPLLPLTPEIGIPELWQRVVDGQSSAACLLKRDGVLAGHNASFRHIFPSGKAPDQIWRWLLLQSEARDDVLVDWDTAWAPYLVSAFRFALNLSPDDLKLFRIRDELRADARAQAAIRARVPIEVTRSKVARPFKHPVYGRGAAQFVSASIDSTPGARLVTVLFSPGPAEAGTF